MKWSDIDPKEFVAEPKSQFDTIVEFQNKDAEFWHLVYDKANYWIEKGFDKEVSLLYLVN